MYFYVFLGVFRHVAQKQISQQKSLETLTHQGFQGFLVGALQGIRTPDLLVRSHNKTKYYQRLYGARDTYFYVQIYHEF